MKRIIFFLAFLFKEAYYFILRPSTFGVKALVFDPDGRLLLVKHNYKNKQYFWHLPGGSLHSGEQIDEAIAREVKEEVGLDIHDIKLEGIYLSERRFHSDYVFLFSSSVTTKKFHFDYEVSEAAFFLLEDLPNNLAYGIRQRLSDYLKPQSNLFRRW